MAGNEWLNTGVLNLYANFVFVHTPLRKEKGEGGGDVSGVDTDRDG